MENRREIVFEGCPKQIWPVGFHNFYIHFIYEKEIFYWIYLSVGKRILPLDLPNPLDDDTEIQKWSHMPF